MTAYQLAVQDLQFWQEGQSFFTCELYALMARADVAKFEKLATAFPLEAKAFKDWYHSPDPDKFFEDVLREDG